MIKNQYRKWIKVLGKVEIKNKELLNNKEITPDIYRLLNKINSDKYEAINKQFNSISRII